MAYGSALSAAEDAPGTRKARGAFFTPPELARFVARWAIRFPGDRVLEPACGEAEFLVAASDRLRSLGANLPWPSVTSSAVKCTRSVPRRPSGDCEP